MSKQQKLAFALGGLAGNNAHGAGFLQAALDQHIKPCMISCTSGQIRWVYHYLNALQAGAAATSLRTIFAQELKGVNRTGNLNTDVALMAVMGKKGVFRPSYEYMFTDFLRNASEAMGAVVRNQGRVLVADQLLSLMPGRTLVPDTDEQVFTDMAALFNASDIGIVFNAYNPEQGEEYVYLNPKAMQQLHDPANPENYKKDRCSEHRPYRYYKAVDAQAIKDALWLYQYGFYDKATQFVDGAYFRDVMLAELVAADLIYSVRPINHKWLGGELPRTYQGIEDLKTEVGFNGAYSAERDQIMLINKLLQKKYLDASKGRGFHHIKLVEVEIEVQRGYFEYMLESQEVFDRANDQARKVFTTA